MGNMTNQWLEGITDRDPGHRPIEVKVEGQILDEVWSAGGMSFRLIGTRRDGKLQIMSLGKKEVDELLGTMAKVASEDARLQLAEEVLLDLSDKEFMQRLATLLSKRANAKEEPQQSAANGNNQD